MNDYEAIERKVKRFANEMIEDAVTAKNQNEVRGHIYMTYSVVLFAANELFPCYNNNLAQWWENEALPIFYRILTNKEEWRKNDWIW